MIKEAIGYGATVDEARENAVISLNASELDDIQFEIVSLPKKKVLGVFGGAKAEVRAFVEVAEKKQKVNKKKDAKPQKADKSTPVKTEVAAKTVEAKAAAPERVYGEYVAADQIAKDSNVGKAVEYIRTILNSFNCNDMNIKVASCENASRILIEGEDVSIIIGRRGETLDAIQYLSSLVANNGGGHYKISINIGDYRERREETLTNLAKRISAQVLKTGKSRTLEHMNPYERRIIHTAVQEIEGVVSNSFGEGNGRRIVISPDGAEVKPPRNNYRRRNDNRRNGSSKPVSTPTEASREPKRDSDLPLYGKIN